MNSEKDLITFLENLEDLHKRIIIAIKINFRYQ